jgi:hypothetical protein
MKQVLACVCDYANITEAGPNIMGWRDTVIVPSFPAQAVRLYAVFVLGFTETDLNRQLDFEVRLLDSSDNNMLTEQQALTVPPVAHPKTPLDSLRMNQIMDLFGAVYPSAGEYKVCVYESEKPIAEASFTVNGVTQNDSSKSN